MRKFNLSHRREGNRCALMFGILERDEDFSLDGGGRVADWERQEFARAAAEHDKQNSRSPSSSLRAGSPLRRRWRSVSGRGNRIFEGVVPFRI